MARLSGKLALIESMRMHARAKPTDRATLTEPLLQAPPIATPAAPAAPAARGGFSATEGSIQPAFAASL